MKTVVNVPTVSNKKTNTLINLQYRTNFFFGTSKATDEKRRIRIWIRDILRRIPIRLESPLLFFCLKTYQDLGPVAGGDKRNREN
jgi:hypothetical protein